MSSRAGKLRFDAVEDDGRGRMGTAAVEVDGADREGLPFAAAEFLSFFKGLLACRERSIQFVIDIGGKGIPVGGKYHDAG